MARVPSLRASDADREQAVERLRHATVEGRLSTDELEERLEALYAARTYGELDALLVDLPVSRAPAPVHLRFPRWAGAAALMLAVLFASAVLRSAAGVVGPEHPRPSRLPGEFAAEHHGFIAASAVGLIAVIAVCAALLWLLMRSRTRSGA